jgi:hypothetical protein
VLFAIYRDESAQWRTDDPKLKRKIIANLADDDNIGYQAYLEERGGSAQVISV